MARKPALSIDSLTELGAEKLALLVLDEAERSTSFRRQVSAALAGKKGPQAIAGIGDRRLGALEKARGFVEWDKARGFRDDLAATVATIRGELGEASPAMGVDRLLRFIATHEQVFEFPSDEENLWDRIRAAREAGFVYYDSSVIRGSEVIAGVTAIGAPIRDSQGSPIAAISIAALTQRLQEPRQSEVVQKLKAVVAEIEQQLA